MPGEVPLDRCPVIYGVVFQAEEAERRLTHCWMIAGRVRKWPQGIAFDNWNAYISSDAAVVENVHVRERVVVIAVFDEPTN